MYQRLVAVLVIGGFAMGAYYVHTSNIEEIVSYAMADSTNPVTEETLPGKYMCDSRTGCHVDVSLALYQNGEAVITRMVRRGTSASQVNVSQESKKTSEEHVQDDASLPVDNSNQESNASETSNSLNEVHKEKGTWKYLGAVVDITILEVDGVLLSTPRHVIAQDLTQTFLTKLIYDKKVYPYFKKPRFLKNQM